MNVQNKPPHEAPRRIQVDKRDNVAIVVNALGLPAGTAFSDGLILNQFVPQGHKVALTDIADGGDIIRYGEVIGTAKGAIKRGDWINEDNVVMGTAPPLDQLEMATRPPPTPEPLTGYTFEGYRNADGTVGTKNILAVSTSVQCVAGTMEFAAQAHQGRAAAQISQRGRCGGADPCLWLRRGDQRAASGGADPHPAEPGQQSQFRRRSPGGGPGLREAGAGTSVAKGPGDRHPAPAGRSLCRFRRDDRRHHGKGRSAAEDPQSAQARNRAGRRADRGHAMRRQRCVLGPHRQSGAGLLRRPAGAGRRHGDVLGSHRGARRHPSADAARRHQGGRRRFGARDALV